MIGNQRRTVSGAKRIWRWVWLAAALAFLAVRLWTLSGARAAWYSDTDMYWRQTKNGLGGGLFGQPRPFAYPLFLWLCGHIEGRIITLQRLIGAGSWLFLALAARRLFGAPAARVAASGVVAALALSQDVAQWDAMLLTESLTLSLWAALLGLAILYWTGGQRFWTLAATICGILIFNGLRDANLQVGAAFLGLLALSEAGRVFRKDPSDPSDRTDRRGGLTKRRSVFRAMGGLGVVAVAAALMAAQNAEIQRSGRFVNNLNNVLCRRVFVHMTSPATAELSPYFQLFVDQYEMPASAISRVGKIASSPGEWPELREWLRKDGMAAYRSFLFSHPGYIHDTLAIPWPPNQCVLYLFDQSDKFDTAHLGLARFLAWMWGAALSGALGWRWLNDVLLALAGALFAGFCVGYWRGRKVAQSDQTDQSDRSDPSDRTSKPFWPLAAVGAVLAGTAWIIRFLAELGDAIEPWRHSLLGQISLDLLAGLAVAAAIEGATRRRGAAKAKRP